MAFCATIRQKTILKLRKILSKSYSLLKNGNVHNDKNMQKSTSDCLVGESINLRHNESKKDSITSLDNLSANPPKNIQSETYSENKHLCCFKIY